MRVSPNLLLVENAYATHAWALSLHGIREVLMSVLEAPIDNSVVNKIQPQGNTYITYPLLCSQRAGVSDIGNTYIDWNPFIEHRYYQKIAEL